MRYEILGPLRVTNGSAPVAINASRERTLLAMLLLHANHPVPRAQLIEAIWAGHPPPGARNQLHGCVSRLRRLLAGNGGAPGLIVTEPAGYRATVAPADLDLHQFRDHVAHARAARAGDQTEAIHHYRAGLALWRGPALADVDSGPVRHGAAALDEEHAQALEERIDLELATSAGSLIAELTDLVGRHPHREGLHRALMLALYRVGRQADALAAYRRARGLLRDELGIEPGAELQRLHQAILNRDPTLDAPPIPPHPPSVPGDRAPAPRELPADVAGFTGRAGALKALDELLASGPDDPPPPVVISAIAGTAGIGKTALAVHWARRVADQFPDGQLYLNLRGYSPEPSLSPVEALSALLRSLGVAPEQVPADEAPAAALYRTQLAGRRMLVLLDNAGSADQVRPLLPGDGSCMVVVTSRDSLAGLVATQGACRLDLDLLPPAEAITLLRRLIGARVDAEPDAAMALTGLCARLPLALRIAAELAAFRPTTTLADLVAELADQRQRLELLEAGGDPDAAIKAVFSWSIQRLPPAAVGTFRLLGLHPGPDTDAYAAAALADLGLAPARRTLELLARAHLVHHTGPGRYGMHDLLRAYAANLMATEEPHEHRRTALTRLFDYYLATAASAMDRLYPSGVHRRPRVAAPTTPSPDFCDPPTAGAWLDAELPTLVQLVASAAAHGWPTHAVQLSSTLFRHLRHGHFTEALTIHGHAQRAATQAGDLTQQAHALRHLGVIHRCMGRLGVAADHLQQAIALYRRAGDRIGEASALTSLGGLTERLGRYKSAADHHRRALTLFRQAGDRIGEASVLDNLGAVEARLGRYESAATHRLQALTLFRQAGDQTEQASTLQNLGTAEAMLGRYESAAEHLQQALNVHRKLGDRQGEARAWSNLGTLHLRHGQPEQAVGHLRRALDLFCEIGDRDGEPFALNGLGEAACATGHPVAALAHHNVALALTIDTGVRYEEARAHAGLGRAHHALDDPAQARLHYEQALARYRQLHLPEADDVRARLANLSQPDGSGDR